MPEFAVRIEQPCAAKMKIVNYKEMTITAKSWLDAQVLVLRTQDERQPEWDDFDVEEIIESSPEGSVEVLCPGQDDDEVNRLLDGRIALDAVKEQLSPENYEWVKKETVRRPAPKERICVRYASDSNRYNWFHGSDSWEKAKEWLREAKAADSRIDFSRMVVFGVLDANWYLYQVDADLEITSSKLTTKEECDAAEQSLIDQGFCLNSPMQKLKEDIHKLRQRQYTSDDAPPYQEQLKALLKPLCEALATLGVVQVVAEFSGYGDDGEFEDFEYLPATERVVPKDLEDALYEWLYEALPGGWEIDDGSRGTVEIDVQACIAHVDIDFNVADTVNEEYDI